MLADTPDLGATADQLIGLLDRCTASDLASRSGRWSGKRGLRYWISMLIVHRLPALLRQ